MPVHTTNAEYDRMYDRWVRCRDVIEGSDAVKGRKETYLPRLEAMTKGDYNSYLGRAMFNNLTDRLLKGFSGVITRRLPEVEYPEGMKSYFDDSTMTGKSFYEVFKFITDEVLSTGRCSVLVDKSVEGGRAYAVLYKAEKLINWMQNGNDPMSLAVLEESVQANSVNDPFSVSEVVKFRALILGEDGYRVETYALPPGADPSVRMDGNGNFVRVYSKEPVLENVFVPTVQGVNIDSIPLTVITPEGIDLHVVKPPIMDIVDINLSHYRTSADLEQGRHWTSLPTPVVSGISGDSKLRVGSQTAWVLPDKDAKAYYLEFTGQGLQSLEKALAEKQQQMVQFSSRLMDTSTRGSEAVDAVKLRNSSDSSTLTTIAYAIEAGLNRIYKQIAFWDGFDPATVNIVLNKDFVNTTLSAAEIASLAKAFVENSIDEETLVFNLKRGELLPQGKHTLDLKRGTTNAPEI